MNLSTMQNVFRVTLGLLMMMAGIAHLTFQREEFQAQVPRWLPTSEAFIDLIVVASGVIEILLGLSMVLLTKYKAKVGIALAIFYVLIFPGNISQYTNAIDAFGLDTDLKRFVRLFFQPVLILWALWSTKVFEHLKDKNK